MHGAGGFIGGHLVKRLLDDRNNYVTAVDIKPFEKWDQLFEFGALNYTADLSRERAAKRFRNNYDEVYMLAADMGGMGFIENNKLDCMLSVLPSTLMLQNCQRGGTKKYFYASSACVYAAGKQDKEQNPALVESDAYPAMAEDGYGWEKLFTERMCRHFHEETDMDVRVGRFHNVYGPYTTWRGGREKAPAAICRKVIEAKLSGNHEIEIWGDGEQTRSFMYVDDCVEGVLRLMDSDFSDPINIGSSELVSINQLVSVAESFAGIQLKRNYDLTKPQGVRGRNSDNTLILSVLGWEPSTSLVEGLEATYRWIYDQMI